MGFLGLGYRRPAAKHVDNGALSDDSQSSSIQPSPEEIPSVEGIPAALSFDRIIDGGTCPPCTTRDFMNYLIYIEHSAENLQFFLWHRDYLARFHSATTADIDLAPEWTQQQQNEAFTRLQKEHREALKRDPAAVAAVFRGTGFEKRSKLQKPSPVFSEGGSNPFTTPPRTPMESDTDSGLSTVYRTQVSEAFASAGISAPFTIQPFREEVDRVIATYVLEKSPRQLNLSERERKQLLLALSHTTHPTAFRQVARTVEAHLRMQSHPAFIRWSICNGNPPRVAFANALGAALIATSVAAYVLLCLSSAARGYRAVPAVGLVLGVATQIAALKGMCVVLHGMHHRHVRPWELFVDEEVEMTGEKGTVGGGGCSHGERESFQSFGSANSYEDEPWVVKYQKRNAVRRIFDREAWIEEPALRTIQDTIFVQAMAAALVTAGVLTAVFVCLPAANLY